MNCLDWPQLIARLSDQARSAPGRAACDALANPEALAQDIDQARVAIAEVSEAAAVLGAGLTLPGLAFEDVG
ncbi:MAG: hypothetical protein H7X95_03280, partial [Deltaproteobacteria bacterium]|nr:hypothetical protein [Deltaproteobacteria bacterium]